MQALTLSKSGTSPLNVAGLVLEGLFLAVVGLGLAGRCQSVPLSPPAGSVTVVLTFRG